MISKAKPIVLTDPLTRRFWARTQVSSPDECWLWTGKLLGKGYGDLNYQAPNAPRVRFRAHRYSYILHHGPIDDPTLMVCHSCDNPKCVNPKHLWLGTNSDNIWDAVAKGRWTTPTGPNPQRKLSPDQVRAIRGSRDSGTSFQTLADVYSVCHHTIRRAYSGQYYAEVNHY